VCAYHCVQLLYTIQHRTVLIIFPYPPDKHTAHMLSNGREGDPACSATPQPHTRTVFNPECSRDTWYLTTPTKASSYTLKSINQATWSIKICCTQMLAHKQERQSPSDCINCPLSLACMLRKQMHTGVIGILVTESLFLLTVTPALSSGRPHNN